MNKIDWGKPIRLARGACGATVGTPCKLVATDRRSSYAYTHVVLIDCVDSVPLVVNNIGCQGGPQLIENVPPPKIKIPYLVGRNGFGQLFIDHNVDWWKSKDRRNVTILSEGVIEVEDKHA